LAIRRLISSGIEVRSLSRLHAKVLLVDGRQITLGSQNFTGYARRSKETSLAADADLGASTLVRILNEWFDEAVPVDGDLVDRLLERLEQPMARARETIQDLINSFGYVERNYPARWPGGGSRNTWLRYACALRLKRCGRPPRSHASQRGRRSRGPTSTGSNQASTSRFFLPTSGVWT